MLWVSHSGLGRISRCLVGVPSCLVWEVERQCDLGRSLGDVHEDPQLGRCVHLFIPSQALPVNFRVTRKPQLTWPLSSRC